MMGRKVARICDRRGMRGNLTRLCAGTMAVAPAAAGAQASVNDGGTVVALVAAGGMIAAAVAAYLFMQLRSLKSRLLEQSQELEHVTGERDDALKNLEEKNREIEETLASQIQALESENDALSAATAKLRKLVVVDELTQLANRQHFDQVLPHEIKRALREEKALSIILGRFDWADAFRESYGQERYDDALQKIADEVRGIFRRAGDLPARFDEDAFAIIFTSDGDIAERFAERLSKAIWNIPIPHDASETADRVTFSIGVATVMPDKVHDAEDLVASAETAVGIATGNGGNQVERYRQPPSQPAAI